MEGKIIILSAPSGCGKSTIINALLGAGEIDMQFSVSATNRRPRPGEVNGVSYHFLSTLEFRERINEGAFIEYEQVYPGRFYGTLKSEIERICHEGHNALLDIDVKGALHVKELYGSKAISIFIEPPSVDVLRKRLERRGTETEEQINDRLSKANEEIEIGRKSDCVVINDNLETAITEVGRRIIEFVRPAKR